MHLDPRLALDRPEHAADVLDDSASEGDRKRYEQRVQRRTIETLAQETAGGHEHYAIAGLRRRKSIDDRSSLLSAHASDQDVWANSHFLKSISDKAHMLLPLRENEAVAARLHGRSDVATDLASPSVILYQRAEDGLDGGRHLACAGDWISVVGWMDD
jgi:hypothetical protein